MIDIIIPAYNAHKTIFDTLCSIAYQTMASKVNVIIADDCSSNDYSSFIDFFKDYFSIKQIRMEKNGGPGVARQTAIDNSSSPYIIFIDSDDCFSDPLAVSRLYKKIRKSKCDVIAANIVQQYENSFDIQNKEFLLHGKIFRRSFLKKNNIRFNDFRYAEDVFFNYLLLLSSAKISKLNNSVYIWRYNVNSLTRNEKFDFFNDPFKDYLAGITMAVEFAIERGYSKRKIARVALEIIGTEYFWYLQNDEEEMGKKVLSYITKINQLCYEYIKYLPEDEINESFSNNFLLYSDSENFDRDLLQELLMDEFRSYI